MNENESKAENRTDLPNSAYLLGVDANGMEHYHASVRRRVWVFDGDDLHHEQDLENKSVWTWVEFVEDKRGDWERIELERGSAWNGLIRDFQNIVESGARWRSLEPNFPTCTWISTSATRKR